MATIKERSGMMIVGRWDDQGRPEVLVHVVKYLGDYRHLRAQTKFPGGSNDDHPEDRDNLDTAIRELWEETGLVADRDKAIHVISELRVSRHEGEHPVDFYFIWREHCQGQLLPRWERVEGKNSVMQNRRFVSFEDVGRRLHQTHQEALLALPEKVNLYKPPLGA